MNPDRRTLLNPTQPVDFDFEEETPMEHPKLSLKLLPDDGGQRRRNGTRFRQEPVPAEYLEAILRLAAQATMECHPHPWHFIVVREIDARERLQWSDAPVVLITFTFGPMRITRLENQGEDMSQPVAGYPADPRPVQSHATDITRCGTSASDFRKLPTGIALTTLMLVAEAYGVGSEPMEGFDAEAVKGEFGIPSDAEVVAVVAMGFAHDPLEEDTTSQTVLREVVHVERYGQPWMG